MKYSCLFIFLSVVVASSVWWKPSDHKFTPVVQIHTWLLEYRILRFDRFSKLISVRLAAAIVNSMVNCHCRLCMVSLQSTIPNYQLLKVWWKLIWVVKIGTQLLQDLGRIKKFFSVRLAAVYSTVNRRCRLFACFFVSDLLLFTACKHAALV